MTRDLSKNPHTPDIFRVRDTLTPEREGFAFRHAGKLTACFDDGGYISGHENTDSITEIPYDIIDELEGAVARRRLDNANPNYTGRRMKPEDLDYLEEVCQSLRS